MSGLPDRLPGRVELPSPNHAATGSDSPLGRDDSYSDRVASRSDRDTGPTHVGQVTADRLRRLLSERELSIVHSVATYRYLTAHQIEQLHFTDHASPNTAARIRRRVLERLVAGQFLDRLARPVGGVRAGSGAHVFTLGSVGYRVTHGRARRSGRPRDGSPSTTFLSHTLAVAQIGVDLSSAVGHGQLERLTVETEPRCWRDYQRGLAGVETLKPDLFAEMVTAEFEDRWFIEVDRATESLTAIRTKCQAYLDYYRTGIEQQRSDVFPRVLWSVPSEKRADQITEVVERLPNVPAGLFVTSVVNETITYLIGGAL